MNFFLSEKGWPWANICASLTPFYMWDTIAPSLDEWCRSTPRIQTHKPRPPKRSMLNLTATPRGPPLQSTVERNWDLSMYGNIPYPWIRRLSIDNMFVLPMLFYIFRVILDYSGLQFRIVVAFCVRKKWQTSSKTNREMRTAKNSQGSSWRRAKLEDPY